MSDNLDFLDGQGPAEPDAAPTPEAAPAEPQGQPRAPDGKFASPATPEPVTATPAAVAPAPTPEPPTPQGPPAGYVPISVVQELRNEMKALKQAPPPPAPDRYEDPEGYEAHREQQLEQRLLNNNLNVSERFARKEHGAEVVDQARDWAKAKFDQDPLYYQRVMNSPDPYDLIVQDHKQEQMLAQIQPDDFAAYQAWKAAQTPQTPATQVASPTPPPRSLASAPSAGGLKPGEQPAGPGVAFNSVIR